MNKKLKVKVMDQQAISAIKKSKLLNQVNASKLNFEKINGKLHSVKGGDILYKEGEKANSIYLLVNGEINLLNGKEKGKTSSIIYHDNDFFGADELFKNVERYTTTISLLDSYLIELTKDEVEFLIQQDKTIEKNLKQLSTEIKQKNLAEIDDIQDSLDDFEMDYDTYDDTIWDHDIDEIISSIEQQEEAILNNITEFEDNELEDFELEATLKEEVDEISIKEFVEQENKLQQEEIPSEKSDEEEFFMSSKQFELIIKSLQLLNSNVRTDDVLKNIVDVAVNLTNADRGTLYVVDKEKNEIWSKVLIADEINEIRLKMGEGIAGWVAQNGGTLNIEDVKEDERFEDKIDEITGYETKNMLCYPVKNKSDEIVAVLQLLNSNKGKFSFEEEKYLDAISLNISAVLENSSLVERLLEAERSMSLDKMGNFLAHDIKKPILTSKRYAEHLRKKELPFETKQIVDMLAEQLNYVADKVSTTAEYTEGTIILRRQNVSLNDTLHKYAAEANTLLTSNNCKIEYNFDKDVNVFIDIKELYQAYYHVVKNSCEALEDGGNIYISTKIIDNKILISFDDKGIGIEQEDLKKVFEPFWTKDKTKNSGLGLSIAKKIIEDHEGTIEIKSDKNNGTIVIIKLPIH
jgi:signal transduction histidine kinase